MGLVIEVGVLSDRTDAEERATFAAALDGLSAALAAKGISWTEPAGPPLARRRAARGFPYSALAYLRRTLALVDTGAEVTPAAGPADLDRDRHIVDDETMMFTSHLLCHSDSTGWFVPVAFDEPLFLPDGSGVAGGGIVGSSQGLLAELRRCATALGITLDEDEALGDAEAARLAALPEDGPFATEIAVWLALHEAARVSVAGGHAIAFA